MGTSNTVEMQRDTKVNTLDATKDALNTVTTVVDSDPADLAMDIKKAKKSIKKRKKVKVEYIIDEEEVDFVLSYKESELSFIFEKSNELMLADQEMFQRQIENFGFAFIYCLKDVILIDDENEEEGETVTDDDSEGDDDIFTDNKKIHHHTP
uniref:Uncharacterized protein n=1 Tax=Oryza punctata TaxID=4537 RepID=A0A0E0MHI4_ORYPU